MFDEFVDSQRSRDLAAGDPELFVEGGGNMNQQRFAEAREPSLDNLERWEGVYTAGGPISQLIDARALMTFGTGTEFVTDRDDALATVDGEQMTVAEWLEQHLPARERDPVLIQLGADAYWAGNAFLELVESKGGGLAGLEPVHPKTIHALWDETGAVQQWVQETRASRFGDELSQKVDSDRLAHFALHRVGRNPMGQSLVGRNWEEVQRFQENQSAIKTALESHAFVKWQVVAHGNINDTDVRRLRQRFRKIRNDNTYVTGEDIEIDPLDTGSIGEGIEKIAQNDIRNLATGFGIPLEWTNFGGDGLGTGKPAESRQTMFERQARAEQRKLANQFIEQVVRPLLAESPFPRDIHVDISWGDVVSDQQAVSDAYRDVQWAYTRDEIREKMGDAPWDGQGEEPPEINPRAQEGGDGGGIFDQVSMQGHDHNHENGTSRDQSQKGDSRPFLSGEAVPAWEHALNQVVETVLWSDATDRQLFEFDDEDVPQFAINRLRDVITGGAVFSDFETVPSGAREAVKSAMLDSLDAQHGWSVGSISENLQDAVPGLEDHEAERIARSETQSIVSKAREEGYREQFDVDEERFDWVGPDDDRNSDACPWIKAQIPEDGVTLDRLKELIQEANRRFVDHEAREWSPHIQCRHQMTRQVR